MFKDVTTLLLDHKAFQDTTDIFVKRYKNKGITAVAGQHSAHPTPHSPQPMQWLVSISFALFLALSQQGLVGFKRLDYCPMSKKHFFAVLYCTIHY